MIKKLSLSFLLLFFTITLIGQTIVGTSPEDKKVVLEEFTGIHCVYCPQGHAIAQAIQDNNPDDVLLINIHVGSYANPGSGEPDFRTSFGTGIVNQTNLAGYPAGTVNRHLFPGQGQDGGTAMGRSKWTSTANQILGESSFVNVAVEAEIDVLTNEMTVHVEAYYTGDSPESSNLLNVALLQNNTKGPQTGGGAGNQYNHMHRLVHLITGQWGINIPVTTAGTFVDEYFTYTIPADYNDVAVELADLELVAFITNTHQEIPSGGGALPTFVNIEHANDANLKSIHELPDTCSDLVTPVVEIQNLGQNTITALTINYSINGNSESYNWTGNITSLRTEVIELPEVSFTLNQNNTIEVTIPNDDDNNNNTQTITFDQAPESTGKIYLELHTDAYGSEVRWNIKDSDGTIIFNGGPYGNNQTINESFQLESTCYTFNLIDTYGDGGGAVTLIDLNNLEIYHTTGNYGSGESQQFSTDGVLGVTNNTLNSLVIYPNPTNSVLNIRNAENATIEIYDLLGRVVATRSNIALEESINVSSLTTGTYLIKVINNNQVKTEKFIINR